MKSRFMAILLVFVFVVGMISTVSAQTMDPCLGLSSGDCAILQAADANAAELTSFTLGFKFNLNVGGLSTLAGMMGAGDEGAPSSLAISADASNSPFVMVPGAAEPTAGIALAMDVNGSISGLGEGVDSSGSVSFVIADGNFYLKNPETGAWEGFSLKEAVDSGMLAEAGLPFDPEAMLEGDMSAMGAATDPAAMLAEAGLSPDDVSALMNVQGFLGQQRVADANLHGQTMAAFESTVDIAALLAAPEFQNILMKASQAAGDDPNAAQIAQMGMILPMLVQQANVKMTRWIGVNDQFPHRLVLEVNALVDIGAMMGGTGGDAPAMEPITLNLVLDVEMDQHNATAAPSAPAGAVMKSLEELQGMGQ